jgi:iron complex outermembrane receptor protein
MQPKYLLFFFLLISTSLWAQNKGSVQGKVKSSDGQPASHVNVILKGTNKGAIANNKGEYEIKNVDPGNYTLLVSFIGLETKEYSIEVKAGETTAVPEVVLNENSQQLDEIVVSGYKTNEFDRKQSDYVAKLPLKNIENPQVYTTISSELIKDQVVTSFNDALKNAPGLDKRWESTGRSGDGAGYFSLRGFVVQPTLINGLPGLTNGGLDIANIERIEVVRGPSGTLYGSSLISYGGLINIVTKKPTYEKFGGEIAYNTGSFGLNRITADINAPLSKEKKVALRVNTAYHNENSFQDAGFRKSFFIAPSLAYEVNDRLSFLVNTEFLAAENTNQTMLFLDRGAPLTVSTIDALNYDHKRSYTSNDLAMKNPTFSLQAQMNYKLSDTWRSQTVLSRSSAKSDGYYSYLYESTQYYAISEGSVFGRYISKQNSSTLTTDIQQNFIGDFTIGNLRNRVVAGLDYYNNSAQNNDTGYVGNGSIYIGNASVKDVNELVFGITDPEAYETDNDSGVLSKAATDAILAGTTLNNTKAEQEVFSAYFSDVLNITPTLSAMVSLRVDHFVNKDDDASNQTALSPKFGIVYQPIKDQLSVFANYMNGFSNVAPRTEGAGENITVRSFDPEQANQWEVGVKTDLYDGKVSATLSYYDILVSNVVRQDATRLNYYVQDGENYSKGIEFSIVTSPLPGMNVMGGYSHNNSKMTKTDSEDFIGRRPESAGPRNMANLWVSYRLREGALQGVGIAVGGNYASEYATLDRATTGTFMIPSYTLLNAALSYSADAFRIAFKVDNLTNEDYYNGWSTINPQKPRNFTTSISFRF